jgi:outer membrane lipoprotein-sorting protein
VNRKTSQTSKPRTVFKPQTALHAFRIHMPLKNTAYGCHLNTLLNASLLFFLCLGSTHASDVLAQITAHLVKTTITQGHFQQEKQLKILRKPLISTGTFTYHESQGIIWKTLSPVTSLLLVNDARLLTSQGELAVPAAFGQVFKAMLGGDLKQLTDGFTLSGSDQKPYWQLALKPKDVLLQKMIDAIVLSGDNELRTLEIQETGGNKTRITFTQITHPTQLDSEQAADFEHLSP